MGKATKVELYFIFILPIINALVNVITNLYKGDVTIGSLRVFIIFLFVLYFVLRRKLTDIGKTIICYNLFLILLLLFATDWLVSAMQVTKVIVAMSSYFIYEYYISSRKRHLLFILISSICLFIYNINLIISQIFKVGDSTYVEDSFYMGGSSVAGTLAMSLLICGVLPFIKYYSSSIKKTQLINVILSAMFILVVMRRTSIIVLILGLIMYSMYYLRNIKSFLYIISTIYIGFLCFSFVMGDSFKERYTARAEQKERWYGEQRFVNTKEGRFTDLELSLSAIEDNGLAFALIGKDVFNTQVLFSNKRTLHNGYSSILAGTGVIGVVFFAYILLQIFLKRNFYHHYKADVFNTALQNQIVIMLMLFVSALFADRLYDFPFVFTVFSYLGATMGCLKSDYKKIIINRMLQ